jgi:hypothetical protein
MSQDRLVELAMIPIEYEMLTKIDCESIIKEAKARKLIFGNPADTGSQM